MKNIVEYILFLSLGYFIRLIGLNLSRKLSYFFTLIFWHFIPIRKDTTLKNLTNAFPSLSEKEIKDIAFKSYRSFVISFFEILYMPSVTSEEMKSFVKCENPELILRKYNENNGVIMLSAHFGNWEYIAASVSLQIGIPLYVIIKQQRNPYVSEWMNRARTKFFNKIIPLGVSIRQVYKELKDRNIVAMVADQRGPAEGIKINFFGRRTSVYSGPAMLALKTNAPILYGISVRQPDYTYHTVINEISMENLPEDEEKKIEEISKRHMEYLEQFIRKYPEQWLWMHKRWKH